MTAMRMEGKSLAGSPLSRNERLRQELVELFGRQKKNIETATQCLKVLPHPARLQILCTLRAGEQNVQNLEYYTGLKQATLSQHLSLLKNREVLVSRREATYSYYKFADERMMELFELVEDIFCE